MKIAKEKVWKTADGKLVKDGDPDASILVAAKGQEVPDKDIEGFENADEFFGGATSGGGSASTEVSNDELEEHTIEGLRDIADREGADLSGLHIKADIIKAIKKNRKK